MRATLERLFEGHFGTRPVRVEPISGDATFRMRFRLVGAGGERAIGVTPDVPEEDRAFVSFTRSLYGAGLPVPRLYRHDESSGAVLVEDAGTESLHAALQTDRRRTGERFSTSIQPAFEEAIDQLARFQIVGGRAADFADAWPRADFDRRAMAWDLAYFKNMFLRLADLAFDEDRLEDDFETLLGDLLDGAEAHFLYRDFQPRNVLLSPDGPRFIDYQGGRRGPLPYDVASFLWSGSADLPASIRDHLLDVYLEALADLLPVDESRFRARVPTFAVLRVCQALGAYGYRGLHFRRPGFAARIGTAVQNLERLLGDRRAVPDLPELRRVLDRAYERADLMRPTAPEAEGLVVRVGSFSYRAGIPRARDGHGGGYVFDCRALPNPGLDPEHRGRSGLDPEVRALLDASDDARRFVERALALVSAQVATYVRKGYASLDVRFGCTGGQHRSVWSTETLARHLRQSHPDIDVRVEHAEARSWPDTARRPA